MGEITLILQDTGTEAQRGGATCTRLLWLGRIPQRDAEALTPGTCERNLVWKRVFAKTRGFHTQLDEGPETP